MDTKKKVLLVGMLPPPVHGQALATQEVFDADWGKVDLEKIDLASSSELAELGSFNLQKFFHFIRSVQKARVFLRANKEKKVIYFTPGFPGVIQYFRDIFFLSLIGARKHRLVLHFHSGGLLEFHENHPVLSKMSAGVLGNLEEIILISEREERALHFYRPKKISFLKNRLNQGSGPERKPLSSGEFLNVVFYSNLCEGKGLWDVLDTASLFRDSKDSKRIRFLIYGSWSADSIRSNFEREIFERKLGGLVEYRGAVVPTERGGVWKDADVFLFPTHFQRENYPLVLLEALQAGVPAITTRWRGIPEILEDGRFGWLCDIRSPGQYFEVLSKLLVNREEISKKFEVYREAVLSESQLRSYTYGESVRDCVLSEDKEISRKFERKESRIAILGHFGGLNTGDEAMLFGFLHGLQRFCMVPIREVGIFLFSKRPYENSYLDDFSYLRQGEPKLLVALRRIPSDGFLVLCGGTHFHDDYEPKRLARHYLYLARILAFSLWARCRGSQVLLLGQGFGPNRTWLGRFLLRSMLRLSTFVSCRDFASQGECQKLLPNEEKAYPVGGDLALGMKEDKTNFVPSKERTVGVSVTYGSGDAGSEEGWLEQLGSALGKELMQDPLMSVEVLCFRGGNRESDTALSRRLIDLVEKASLDGAHLGERCQIRYYRDNPLEVLEIMRSYRYFVATRFHSAVLASIAGCRLGVLAYHRKLIDFSNQLGLSEGLLVDLSQKSDHERIVLMVSDLLSDKEEVREIETMTESCGVHFPSIILERLKYD